MSNNKSPIAFPAAAPEAVPILGQPVALHGWFPTLSLTCNCERKGQVLVVGLGNPHFCPSCGRGFQLFGVSHDVRTGKPPHFELNIILPAPAGSTEAGETAQPS